MRLIADVGGTNARFALADGATDIWHETVLEVRAHPSLAAAARSFLDRFSGSTDDLAEAVIAVATPVDAEVVRFTNNPWRFTRDELRSALGVARLAVINDFVAQAAAIPELGPEDSELIGGGAARAGWPIAVIGPGTGLGAAGLVPSSDRWIVVASEGGHVSFAPGDATELALLEWLMKEHGHISNERLISGPGLLTLARGFAELSGDSLAAGTPEAVTAAAEDGSCPICVEAVERFSGLLGAAAGDLALSFGAKGGVFVAGGLCAALGPLFDRVAFRRRFEAKGRLSGFLADVPTRLITRPQTGLLGAAAYRIG